MTKTKHLLIFLTVFSLLLGLVSCTGNVPDETDPDTTPSTTAEETTAGADEENSLARALELISEAERRSEEYTSFAQSASSAAYYDDTLISQVTSTTKKNGDAYSFIQSTEAFDLYGNPSGEHTLELFFDGQSIVYYDTSAFSTDNSFGAIRIVDATKEEFLSMLLSADSGILGFTDPEYFKSGTVTPADGGYAVTLEYSDAGKALIFGSLGLTLSEEINAEVLEFSVYIDSEGNAVSSSAETVISLDTNGVSSKIRSVSSSEYTNINSNSSVDETSAPNISLEFGSFRDYSTVAGMTNTLALLASGSYALEYESKMELTNNFHPPYAGDLLTYTIDSRGAYDPARGYSYGYSASDGQVFKEYGDFKNYYTDAGQGISGPHGFYYDVTSLVSIFREIKPYFFSLEFIDGITGVEYSGADIKISLDIDSSRLLSYLDMYQLKFPVDRQIFEPSKSTSVSKKNVDIVLSPEGLPLSFSIYFEGLTTSGYYSDACDITFSHTVTFTSYNNVNIEVMP